MAYAIKEMFLTLQGEGVHFGRVAVLVRFAGCNLWSGLEKDRATAICQFCDTDFVGMDGVGGGRYETAEDLAHAIAALWPTTNRDGRFMFFTGGEPLLQLDPPLIDAVHRQGFEIAVETNGTIACPGGIDWICVSPKAGTELVQRAGDELKLVYPQQGAEPHRFEDLDFRHFALQPMDGPNLAENTQATVAYCLRNPRWRLSLQAHKLLHIP